jgi:hypothetical protein
MKWRCNKNGSFEIACASRLTLAASDILKSKPLKMFQQEAGRAKNLGAETGTTNKQAAQTRVFVYMHSSFVGNIRLRT